MSASPDQSYYEIALTNRQVMSIFVVLLVCILAAFLGGVWLGRDADTAVEMASAQSITANANGEAPLEELGFFTRRDQAATAPEGLHETAVASDDGAESLADRPEPATAGARQDSAQPPAAAAAALDGSEVEAFASDLTTSASEPAADVEPEAGAVLAVPDAVVVQVFSSNEETQARRVVEQLLESGYPAVLSPVEVAGRTLHRVRIGPYADPDEAQVVAESVRRAFKLDTWITH